MKQVKWIEIGDAFTPEGLAKVKAGQILKFNYEGSIVNYKVMRKNRKSGKCFVKPVDLYTEDQVSVVDRKPTQ